MSAQRAKSPLEEGECWYVWEGAGIERMRFRRWQKRSGWGFLTVWREDRHGVTSVWPSQWGEGDTGPYRTLEEARQASTNVVRRHIAQAEASAAYWRERLRP